MSNVSISNLPSVTSAQSSSQVPAVQNGTTVYLTVDQIAKYTQQTYPITGITSITAQSPLSGGTITSSGSIGLTTNSVSNSYLSPMASNTIKGNNTGSSGNPIDLTVAQTMTMLGAAPLASPAFTGVPTAPTPVSSDSSNTIATTAFVKAQSYGGGTVTSITAGAGLSGGTITTSGTISLPTTGVTAGTYGSSSSAPSISVDQYGRITSASSASITPSSIGAVPSTRNVNTSGALTGGGALSSDLTLSLAAIPNGNLIANTSGGSSSPSSTTVSALLDTSISSQQGSFLYRDAVHWVALSPGLAGQILTTGGTGSNPYWTSVGSGTVTNINTGTGLTGGPITLSGTISLANTAVTAGSYGNASSVSTITVNAQGQITNASNTAIAIGVAAVSGAVPNTVNVIAGTNLTGGGALTGNVTINNPYNGTVTNVATGTGLTGGPITSTGTISLANTAVTAGSYGTASSVPTVTVNAQGQLTTASNVAISIPASAINTVIPNTGLANSSITINGNTVSLGGSTTITASTSGTLTFGTGLTGTSFNGSTNVTTSLANTTVTAGSYGSASSVPTYTVNAQGQLTAASNTAIAISAAQITSGVLPTTYGGTGLSSFTSGGAVYATSSSVLTTGTLPVSSGGTGAATLTGYIYGNGTSAMTASTTIPNTAITGLGTMSTQNANSVAITGGTATLSSVTLTTGTISTTPANATDIANKSYVDNALNNINYHAAASWATTADLGSVTYNNGASGVGATITNAGTQAALVIDGHTFTASDASNAVRVLVKNESNGAYNGVYTVTNQGSGSTNWILTRATDYDQTGTGQNEIAPGDYIFVINGTANANTAWIQSTPPPITIGTTAINFIQVAGTGTYTAGTGLSLSGNQFSITNTTVTAASYGSSTAIPTFTVNAQGQLTAASTAAVIAPAGTLSGNTLNSTVINSSLTSVGTIGTGVWQGTTIATGYGGTGLTSFTSGGAVYATSTSALTTGTLPVASGGTGQASALTQYGVVYGSTTTAMATTAAGTTGQVLIAITGGAPSWSSSIPSTAGVTSFSAGTTGLTPNTATTGAITLAGTLATGNGGTGLTGFAAANNAIYSTSSSALTAGTLPAAAGGTGQASYVIGDLLYASSTTALSRLADVATGSVLVSGGVGVAPSWSATPTVTSINYSTAVGSTSTTVPTVYGGTGVGSSLTLQSTSGSGASDSIVMKVGNAGATTAISIATTGIVSFPTTGAIVLPVGTTAQEPSSPASGMLRFNSSTANFEGYNGSAWSGLGGATGGGTDQIFWQNGQTVNTSYSIPASTNAGTFGPVTISSSATVSIPASSTWTVV